MANTNNITTPQDICVVSAVSNHVDLPILLDLYQPIVGTSAVNLYLTLHNRATTLSRESAIASKDNACLHRQLVAASNLSFPSLIKAREMLEAIGLLSTLCYKKNDEDKFLYEYRLLEPLTGVAFFTCDLLPLLLASRIDDESYAALKTKHTDYERAKIDGYELYGDVTKAFDEVFNHINLTKLVPPSEKSGHKLAHLHDKGPNIKLKQNYLDIELIKGLVSNLHHLEKSLDSELITKLNKLAFLYQFSDVEIASLLNDQYVYDAKGMVDYNLLRERALEKFRATDKKVRITPVATATKKGEKSVQSVEQTSAQAKTKLTKAEQHRLILESYSPIQLIQQYQGKGIVASSDLKIIDRLLHEYQLSPAVANVLLEYVMLTNDYKLPRSLIEKIAAHWSRLNIKTVDEAMQAAKKERKVSGAAKPKSNTRREELPDYILQQEERYHQQTTTEQEQTLSPEQNVELERLIRKYK